MSTPKDRHQPNMVDPHTEPPYFLKLPLELRDLIYKDVLTHPSNGTQLIRTCREINAEAYKYLFQRPLVFRGQSRLYQWLEHAPPGHLSYVTDVTLELHDADLRPLIAPTAGAAEGGTPLRLQAWDVYHDDLEKLRRSAAKLGRVKSLTIRALSGSRSHLYRDFLSDFLDSLDDVWPGLQSLRLEGNFHDQDLSFLTTLSDLHSLSFDGFSSTPPIELATLLSDLQRLQSLELVSQHGLLTPTTHLHSYFTSNRQSFTNDVLSRMKHQLASFSVIERIQPASAPALFLTPAMLETLHTQSALKRLTIRLSRHPDPPTLEALDAFLEKSTIERLEFDWPDFDSSALETHSLLPSSLRWFWVKVPGMAVAFDVLYTILDSLEGGDMENLRKVVLVRQEGGEWEDGETRYAEADDVGEAHGAVLRDLETPRGEEDTGAEEVDRTTDGAEQEAGVDTTLDVGLTTDAGVEASADVKPEAEADENVDTEAQVDVEPEVDTEATAEPEPETDTAEAEVGAEATAATETTGAEPSYEENDPANTSTYEDDVARAIRCLNDRGVQVLWCTYDS